MMNKKLKSRTRDLYFGISDSITQNSQLPEDINRILRKAASFNSCCLEYNINPGIIPTDYSPEDLKLWEKQIPLLHDLLIEIENHNKLLIMMEELIHQNRDIDTESYKNLHHILYVRTHYNKAGKFRDNNNSNNKIIKTTTPSDYHLLPEQMEQHFQWLESRLKLIKDIQDNSFYEVFHIAAEASFRFFTTTPFMIGNGIMSRLAADYVFLKTNLFFNPIDFHNKRAYESALGKTTFNNINPLSDFLFDNFTKNLKNITKLLLPINNN